MARVCPISFALFLALEFYGAHASPSYSSANCIKEMNAAREQVGFAPFSVPQEADRKFPTSKQSNDTVAKICKIAQEESTLGNDLVDEDKGVALYAPQAGAKEDCAAAVQHWKGAFTNFNGPPPPYASAEEKYKNAKNVSFVGLYNPNAKPTVECVLATCPPSSQQKNSGKNPGSSSQGENPKQKESGGGKRRLSAKGTIYGLYCYTTPGLKANGGAPFSEAQWKTISNALASANGAASAAASTLLAFTLAALGIGFF